MNELIPFADIEAAAARLRTVLAPTPLIRSSYYSERVGAQVYFKLEMLQPTHSFKVRGAFNAMLSLPPERRQRGVMAASGGNHGLGVTLAAARLGVPAEIYLPHSTPALKQDAIRALGGQVTLFGAAWDEANQEALRVAAASDRPYIHPFDDAQVMAGQATVFMEIAQQLPDVSAVIASIGGGGLISGLISAKQHLRPQVRVYGVETVGADSMAQSRAQGRIVELPAITSICESLGARKTAPRQFAIVSQYAEDLIVVSDAAAVATMFELLDREKLLVEPATACSLNTLVEGHIPVQPGESIVVILCGANITLDLARQYEARFLR
jgi:threonine dehydratase